MNTNNPDTTMLPFDTTLESAIRNLAAVEVAPGRYAFQLHDEHHRWRVGTEQQVRSMSGGRLEAPMMPNWWAPNQQVYCKACKHSSSHTDQVCYCSAPCNCKDCGGYEECGYEMVDGMHPCCCDRTALAKGQLVAVDLTTGEEIAA